MKTQYHLNPLEPNLQQDPQPISKLLCNQTLQALVHKAQQMIEVNELLNELLPSQLLGHVRCMNIDADHLVISVDSAAWVTRLRCCEVALIAKLNIYPFLKNVQSLKIKVRPKNG